MEQDTQTEIESTTGASSAESAVLTDGLERDTIIARAITMRAEIQQIFIDAEHWNSLHTPWKEAIDPDPDGELKRLAERLDKVIENERSNVTNSPAP